MLFFGCLFFLFFLHYCLERIVTEQHLLSVRILSGFLFDFVALHLQKSKNPLVDAFACFAGVHRFLLSSPNYWRFNYATEFSLVKKWLTQNPLARDFLPGGGRRESAPWQPERTEKALGGWAAPLRRANASHSISVHTTKICRGQPHLEGHGDGEDATEGRRGRRQAQRASQQPQNDVREQGERLKKQNKTYQQTWYLYKPKVPYSHMIMIIAERNTSSRHL